MIYTLNRFKGSEKIALILAIEHYKYQPEDGRYWIPMDGSSAIYSKIPPTEVREHRRFLTIKSEEMLNEKRLIQEIFK
jgi:hypothetical protein